MDHVTNLRLLGNKMDKLGTALFSNSSKALMRFPTSLVRLADRDDSGGVWFSLQRKYTDMSGFDRTFPGQLHFYNRAFHYRMEVEGSATIVTEAEDVLIRFQVTDAHCLYFPGKKMETFVKTDNSGRSMCCEDTLTGKMFIYEIQL
jgi:hypothetical protein